MRSLSLSLSLFFPPLLLLFLPPLASPHAFPALLDAKLYAVDREEYERFAEHFLLPEDFDLAENIPIRKPTPFELDSILNHRLFEGDIMGIAPAPLTLRADVPLALDEGTEADYAQIFSIPFYSALNTKTYADKLWNDAKVPYMLEEGMSASQRAAIASAFDEYKGKTCIRFVPRQSSDADYIFVKRNYGFGCSSYVGRAGGNQTVSLEVDKCFSKGIIAHELMHALGFFHEHSRTDRDEYVDILEENIRQGMMRNFEKYPKKIIDPLGMPYDYDSVMHYHKLAFSRNGRATIVPKRKSAEIGQRYKLSEIDAQKVNKLYGCDSIEKETTDGKKEEIETTPAAVTTMLPSSTTMEEGTTAEGEEGETEGGEVDRGTSTVAEGKGQTEGSSTNLASTDSTTTVEEKTTETVDEGGTRRGRMGGRERKEGTGGKSKYITLSIWSTRSSLKQHRRSGKATESSNGGERRGLSRIWSGGESGKGGRKAGSGKGKCVDLNAHCEMWERLGHCTHSAKYMRHYCRKSCGFCEDKWESEKERRRQLNLCIDRNHFCTYWAQNGECDNGSKFMKLFCKRSCELC